MSYKAVMGLIAASLLVSAITLIDIQRERREGPVFIASSGPISEDQIRQKMQSEGWTNVQITRERRYFQAVGTKDQQTSKFTFDPQTGRLRAEDDGDND
jgi:hypothetical protein